MTGNYGQHGRQNVSLFNVIATPVLIMILVSVLLVTNLVSLISSLVKGGEIVYEEKALATYVDEVYNGQFVKVGNNKIEGKNAKTSGIAIMFYYNEDKKIIEHTVKIGTNVNTEVEPAFSGEKSAMVKYLTDKVNVNDRKDSLSTVLAGMMDELAKEIDSYDLTSPFIQNNNLKNVPASVAVSKDESVISKKDAEALSAAMVAFTDATGIPVIVTIDSSVRAFGRTVSKSNIFMVILLLAVMALCIVNLVKKIREYNRIKNDFAGQDPMQTNIKVNARSPYYDDDEDDDAPVDDFEAVDESDGDEEETEEEGIDEESEEESADGEEPEEETEKELLKKRSLNAESDEEDEDEGDENLSFEDEDDDEDNGIIDGGDENYDDENYTEDGE